MKIYRLVCFFICFSLLSVSGQYRSLPSKISPGTIRIGEQAKLSIELPEGIIAKPRIEWPHDSLLNGIEFLKDIRFDSLPGKEPANFRLRATILVTAFDSGYYPVPPLKVIQAKDTFYSEAMLLTVQTIPVDTAQASIRPEKGLADIPFDWREYIPAALGILAGIIALILGYFLWKNVKRKVDVQPEVVAPLDPPDVIALKALEELRLMQLWEKGDFKEYHIRLSDIIRMYIETRFEFGALEQTTEEIMLGLRRLPKTQTAGLKEALLLADYVKFAKAIPLAHENQRSMEQVIAFISSTKLSASDVVA